MWPNAVRPPETPLIQTRPGPLSRNSIRTYRVPGGTVPRASTRCQSVVPLSDCALGSPRKPDGVVVVLDCEPMNCWFASQYVSATYAEPPKTSCVRIVATASM